MTMRFWFAQWAEQRLVEDEHFYWKIIFSDEVHFHLGYVNKQNCRIWESESARRHGEADASTTSDCLMWFLVRRYHWAIFLRKWARSYRQLRALPYHVKRILASQIWRGGHRRHLVSTGRCTLTHNQRYNRSFALSSKIA